MVACRPSAHTPLRGRLYDSGSVDSDLLADAQPGDFAILTPPPSKSEDEVRKWTEKRSKRSKSLPRGGLSEPIESESGDSSDPIADDPTRAAKAQLKKAKDETRQTRRSTVEERDATLGHP